MHQLLPYPARELVFERLPLIFPEGTPNRIKCTGKAAASTIFAMLYIGAVEGNDVFLGPVHVVRMSDQQAALNDDASRINYRKKYRPIGTRWYEDNSRETIRDEVIREGMIPLGAMMVRAGVVTTSGQPRYFLQRDFSALFNPDLTGRELAKNIEQWQKKHLSKSALTRIQLAKLQGGSETDIVVMLPNGETRKLSGGLSSQISKAVVEVFASRFLEAPALLWLSTSDSKIVAKDDLVASSIGLKIDVSKELPDIILVDLKPEHPLLVFVEVVATDGAITERRQNAIYALTDAAGFDRRHVAFVTAYLDRSSSGFSKTFKNLAWNSYAWCVSEPDKIIMLKDGISFISKLNGM